MVVLSNFPPPTEGIKHQQPCTLAVVNNREIGKGTLFIAESRLAWVNSSTGQGFSVEYPNISMHAISRDLQAYEQECLYLMLDLKLDDVGNDGDSANDDDSDGSNMTEMRFVPDDKGMLDAIFHAINECQILHPDPNDSFSDEEEIFEDADEEGEYNVIDEAPRIDGGDRLNGRESDEAMETDGQFEDAEYDSDH